MFKRYQSLPRWSRWTIEILVFVAIFLAIRAYQAPDIEAGSAPDFQGITLDGQTVSLAEYRGEPLLIVVWAEWCRICRIELPMIQPLAKDHQVLTIAIQSGTDEEVRQFLEEQDLHQLPVLNDPQSQLANALGVRGVPVMFILDREGTIRFTEVGLTSGWGLKARLWWAGRY
ncbi:protein disulfide oxidoreductase [Nitrincola schmidtii]|uniref:protein disulfide oxidoreductase n=1 Tax=Nitrincola schmidtii TaxID=1730894 RepID=UPI00124E2044|nr:protein disulfide oxidoreductase [Nitrincola schmidtii]